MATTVIAAFNEFMKDTVNLKKADTDDARASRDWLIGKMNDFEKDDVWLNRARCHLYHPE